MNDGSISQRKAIHTLTNNYNVFYGRSCAAPVSTVLHRHGRGLQISDPIEDTFVAPSCTAREGAVGTRTATESVEEGVRVGRKWTDRHVIVEISNNRSK